MDASTLHAFPSEVLNVYPPSEDTWLLMDALSNECSWIIERFRLDDTTASPISLASSLATTFVPSFAPPLVVADVGTGSGAVLSHAAKILGNKITFIGVGIDINADACRVALQTFRTDHVNADTLRCSLLSAINSEKWPIDLVLCNPPYVPTEHEEMHTAQREDDIHAAWAGGVRGREVVDRLLEDIHKKTSERAVFYCVQLVENEPEQMHAIMESAGFDYKIVAAKRAGREKLSVCRYARRIGSEKKAAPL